MKEGLIFGLIFTMSIGIGISTIAIGLTTFSMYGPYIGVGIAAAWFILACGLVGWLFDLIL